MNPRAAALLVLAVATSGCTFAGYARRSNGYPGAYDRALANAAQVSPALHAEIEALGASTSYDHATHEVLWCLDGYADGLRWKRQREHGDVFDGAAIRARLRARGERPEDDLKYAPELRWLDTPEDQWLSEMERCASACADVAEAHRAAAGNPRDVAIAARYLGLCRAEVAAASAVVAARKDRERAGDLDATLARGDGYAREGQFLWLLECIESVERRLREIHDPAAAQRANARVDEWRRRFADGLARAARHRTDPATIQLQRRLDSLETDRALLDQEIEETDRRVHATAATRSYDASGNRVGDSSGNPEAHARYRERLVLLQRKRQEIDLRRREIEAAQVALEKEHGVR